jgi:hypothetical protein
MLAVFPTRWLAFRAGGHHSGKNAVMRFIVMGGSFSTKEFDTLCRHAPTRRDFSCSFLGAAPVR